MIGLKISLIMERKEISIFKYVGRDLDYSAER